MSIGAAGAAAVGFFSHRDRYESIEKKLQARKKECSKRACSSRRALCSCARENYLDYWSLVIVYACKSLQKLQRLQLASEGGEKLKIV